MSKSASQPSVESDRFTRVLRQHRHPAVRSLPSALCVNVDDMTVVGLRVRG